MNAVAKAVIVLILLCPATAVVSESRDAAEKVPSVTWADPTDDARSASAIERFWVAYHGNDYRSIPVVQAQLQAALRHDAANPTLVALLGATYFWHFGEAKRDPNANGTTLDRDMQAATKLFRKALELDYYRPHPVGYINDDHLPGYLGIASVHAGEIARNSNLIARGDAILDFAVYQFPEFNNFNRWAAHNSDPKDSAEYGKALDSLWQAIDACIGAHLDRANPDIGPYLQLQTSTGRKKACWPGGDLAPYAFEGMMLNLGNGLVKSGQIRSARIVYANAKYAANYASWPYRGSLEAVASSDLEARAALYDDNDRTNDPPLGVPDRGCVYCHATRGEPEGSTPRLDR
jgi:hypothetical protein